MMELSLLDRYLYWEQWILMGLVLSVTLVVWKAIGSSKKQHISLPPGSTGWPLIGESINFYRALRSPLHPRQFIDDHEKRYGPIFRSHLFGRAHMIVSVDPEFNKYVLQNEGRLFDANYPLSMKNLLGKYGILTVHGDLQRKLHGIAANLLKNDLISSFMDDIQNAIDAGIQRWQHKSVIKLHKECNKVLLNIMGKKLLDLPPYEEMKEIYEAFEVFVAAVIQVPIKFPGSTYARGIKGRETLVRKIKDCIADRRQHPEVIHNDLLTKIVREESLPDEIISDFLLALMLAGYETSSTAMAFSIKFLTDCPQALEELRVEHDSLLRDNGNSKITWENYQEMKFTHCVIKETLRLGSIATGIFREAKHDIKFKDFVIPKGWTVYVLLVGMHLDEKYYPKPSTFNPWRWKNESSLDLSENPSYMPFGKGARLCPGYQLARFEISLFLHNLVTKFRWESIEDDRFCYFPISTLVKGFPIRLYDRK